VAKKSPNRTYADLRRFVEERSALKRDVFELGKVRFAELKQALKADMERLAKDVRGKDERLEIKYHDRNEFECGCTVAGDYVLFHMHTNVFRLDADGEQDAFYPESEYLREKSQRTYCAVINVYNFLADSFRHERNSDAGYLVSRIFINSENHFFTEGIGKAVYAYEKFADSEITGRAIPKVLRTVIYEALNFEMLVPEYSLVSEIALNDAVRSGGLTGYRTSKRMGFRLSSDPEEFRH
jgi:hypothetical protein